MGSTFLQIFLLVNVFVIGMLVTVGVRHARAHFSREPEPTKPKAGDVRIPPALRERLLHEAEAHFQIVINTNAKKLANDLDSVSDDAVNHFKKLTADAIERQTTLHAQALADIASLNEKLLAESKEAAIGNAGDISRLTAESVARLDSELKEVGDKRKAELLSGIDAKMSEAVVSFLVESLGHDIDLGSQMKYILARLDENKDALKAEVSR